MLVSALLTSVVLNSILCVLLLVSYSSLRRNPNNYEVYIPRFLGDATAKGKNRFNLVRWSSSSSWIAKAWNVSEAELLESSGLDAVVFMRMITLSLEIFVLAGIIGIFILLPINCSGDQLQAIDFSDLVNNSLDLFTISNIKSRSPRLWVHFAAVYILTAFTCYLLYGEFRYISSKRVEYFCSSKPQPHQFTILVRGIPQDLSSSGGSVSETVGRFFKEYHSSQYLSHLVIRRTSKIRYLVNHAKKIYKKLKQMKSDPAQDKKPCAGFFRPNTTDQYQKQLEDLEQNLKLGQTEVSLPGKEVLAAFVSFKSRYGAAIALHMPQSLDPTLWITEPAPEPRDVYWPFFSTSFMKKWISKTVIVVTCITLTVLFLIPVVLVQGLTNLSTLEYWFPFLAGILSIEFVRQIVTGYLPSLILEASLKTVPPIMEFLSSIQGYICFSDIEKSACSKVIWFTIWNVFFATVFSGSALYQVSVFFEPKDIPAKLAVGVPAQASFFIAYVVTTGWTSTLVRLIRFFPLVVNFIKRIFKITDDDVEVPSIPYHRDIPKVLFFGLLGFTYFILAPLILPFLVIFFCLAYIIYKNEFINVYAPKYETAGRFWPIVHNTMIFSLLLMHAIAIGIFTIKKMALKTALLFPLPIFTLLFNQYCRKSFLTIFQAYPAELLINIDKEDQKIENIQEFYSGLATAYLDPALLPFQFSASKDGLTSPLLSSSV